MPILHMAELFKRCSLATNRELTQQASNRL